MIKLSDFNQENNDKNLPPFLDQLKSKWDDIHSNTNVFRYKIDSLQEKVLNGGYVLVANEDRGSNRRLPQDIVSIRQPFDDNRFNFTKVSPKEIMFSIEFQGKEHSVLVNVSPILRYHALLCPSVNERLPQVITVESLLLAAEIMFLAKDRALRIVFNSLCAFASVNHLHYHLMLHRQPWPVESVKWEQLIGPVHYIQDYPVHAFCFEIQREAIQTDIASTFKLIQYLQSSSIAHNVLITYREENVAVFIYPRKSVVGAKEFGDFNVAALELGGLITVYSDQAFHSCRAEDIEAQLKKWTIEKFDELCDGVKLLYY